MVPSRSSRVALERLGVGTLCAFVGSDAVAFLWFHVHFHLVPIDDPYR